ncbi:hypothetical protein SLEP1_g41352 [Rubroshorea leprosula]|uniref:Uncharacterized protein n=1 Tax=Rubroshorea leprosula TaxID=152421 RepID=A0AAV5L7K5_9ROSI|nr:hypothetical protein SLEP1_g41352 [Rubroshorea leprosula]
MNWPIKTAKIRKGKVEQKLQQPDLTATESLMWEVVKSIHNDNSNLWTIECQGAGQSER